MQNMSKAPSSVLARGRPCTKGDVMDFQELNQHFRRFLDENDIQGDVVVEIRPKRNRDFGRIRSAIQFTHRGPLDQILEIPGELQYDNLGVKYRLVDRTPLGAL